MPKRKEPKAQDSHLPSRYGQPGSEANSGIPVEMPLSSRKPTPLHEIIARMVRQHVAEETSEEPETFEESEDFDDFDPDTLDMSPYELTEVHLEAIDVPEPPSEAVEQAISESPGVTPQPQSVVPSEDAETA